MKKLLIAGLVIFSLSACMKKEEGLQIPTGSDVTVERRDGVKVEGKLIEVKPDHVVLQLRAERNAKSRGPRSPRSVLPRKSPQGVAEPEARRPRERGGRSGRNAAE